MAAASKTPEVVIVGAGIGGAKLLKGLAATGKFNITLVEPREYSEVLFAGVRAVVDPSVADKSLIPIASIPGKFNHVREFAKTITSKSVVLTSGQELAFDYLVVGTGSRHAGAGTYAPGATALTIEARKAELKATADQIKAAKSIAVVGGGPVGLELIGEIVNKYAGKEITLVHAGKQLLEGKAPKMQKHIDYLLAKYKVKVLLDERAEKVEQGVLTTKSGKSVPAEVVVWAAGGAPNSALFEGGDLASSLNERGYVKVDEFLRLEQHPNIFILGDINSTPGPKLGAQAGFQADSIVANLPKAVAGKPLAKFAPPMPPTGGMFVTFGPSDGTGHVQGCACTGGFPIAWIKGKDLFVGMARGNLGVK